MTEQACTNVRARIRSMFSILKGGLSFMIHLKMENLYLSTAKILVKTLNSFGLWILYILGLQTHMFGLGVLCPVNFFTSRLSSVQFSCSVMSNYFRPHGLQHARPPCPSPTPGVYPNSSPLSWWCHPTISSSAVLFSSRLQSFPSSGSFQMNQLFTSGSQSIEVSASGLVLPVNTQDWSPLGWNGLISLQSKGLSRVFSNTTVQKHQFSYAQLSL